MFNLSNIMIILAVIASVIQLVETLLGDGTGEQKKQAVLTAVTQIITELKITLPTIITSNLSAIIDAIVAIYNIVGTFTKKK